jgi:hypothetical protein
MTARKNAITPKKTRELLLEQITRAVEKRGYIEKLFNTIDSIESAKDKSKLMLDILQYVIPKLASQAIQVTEDKATVTNINVSRAEPLKSVSSKD